VDGPFPGGCRAAVSLTYDDGLACHRELVAPMLSARGLRGTFFCPASADDLHAHVSGWRSLATAGHEIGNHTCFHPCRAADGVAWPDRAYDLRGYNRLRIRDEVRLAQRVLALVDGRERRAFGATCGHTTVGPDGAEESFLDDLRPFTTHVRAGRGGPLPLAPAPFVAGSLVADGRRAVDLIALLEPVVAAGGWLRLLMHGVGAGTHPLFIAVDEHARLCDWIANRPDLLWAPTVSEAVAALAR
jgi:peptidoglycan/xylan/chitin deacetylase (PgdA/CDA1 family)